MKQLKIGKTKNNQEIFLWTFENSKGMKMTVSNIGAVLTNLWIPDRSGNLQDVVLGFDNVLNYATNDNNYLGSTIGRSANRLANASFELKGTIYNLTKNDGKNNLHSGPNGYQLRIWEVKNINKEKDMIVFSLKSLDGDQGYPGTLDIDVTYQLTEDAVMIKYQGISDADTLFNPTNHSYFNLNGHQNGSILNHRLQLKASYFTPIRSNDSIPTGEIKSVENTPMDFRMEKTIGRDIRDEYNQLIFANGYDHNFVLDKVGKFAKLTGDQSSIVMQVATNLPGVQIYSGNFLKETSGKLGTVYSSRSGICLETQYFPNAVNELNFETPILEKNKTVEYWSTYSFSVEE